MGHDHASKSSTANDVTTNITSSPAVGRKPLTQSLPAGPTGDTYIDHGAVCERDGNGGDCFLTKEQRTRLITDMQFRMSEAATHYLLAAEQVRVDELMAREEDLPIVIGLVLDLAVAYAGAKALLALTNMKTNFASAFNDAIYRGEMVSDTRTKAHHALFRITPQHMTTAINTPFAQAKTQVSAQLKNAANAPKNSQKEENLSYLEQLTTQAQLAFTKVREEVPGTASDAELIAWREAFAPQEHLVGQYKTALTEKLARLRASGAQSIERRDKATNGLGGDHRETDREGEEGFLGLWGGSNEYHDAGLFVIWHLYASGSPKELIFRWAGRSERANVFATGHHLGPRHGGEAPDTGPRPNLLIPWVPNEVVPPEFHDYAVARHTQVWGAPPGEEMIDDSTWYWAPERAKKAADNKVKDPFLVPATSHEDLAAKARSRTGLPPKPQPLSTPAAPPIAQRPVPRLDLTVKRKDGIDRGGDPEPGDFQ